MRLGPVLELAALAWLLSSAGAHAHDVPSNCTVDMDGVPASPIPPLPTSPSQNATSASEPSYFAHPAYSGFVIAHVTLMMFSWLFILPIGVVLSISQSRLKLPVQFLFLVCNAFGLVAGTLYNSKTPDLYENNAHHKLGWVVTWITLAQALMEIVGSYNRRSKWSFVTRNEQAALITVSFGTMTERHRAHAVPEAHGFRFSNDSGQGTERASSSLRSHSLSSREEGEGVRFSDHPKCMYDVEGDNPDGDFDENEGPLPASRIPKFLAESIPDLLSVKLLELISLTNNVLDRVILVLGFMAIASGVATYGGLFRGKLIFSGLAHWVKGGIFFWYGLITFSRWMGCFAELGWAWNMKPSAMVVGSRKASMPSAEFVESFLIFLYGSTNVFLEHLAGWGKAWSAQDLEHVSIAGLFFGGGLCGMLVESRSVRNLLHTSILVTSAGSRLQEAQEAWKSPRTYHISLNPLPGLVVMLLGLMMASHHQESMVSTMLHKQWGSMLVGSALARAVTYLLSYLSPPTSLLPSRPPSEIVAAFCLISGGFILMASSSDTVTSIEEHNLSAMLVFTVTMGLTAFLMAWMTLVFACKGWAIQRELPPAFVAHLRA